MYFPNVAKSKTAIIKRNLKQNADQPTANLT